MTWFLKTSAESINRSSVYKLAFQESFGVCFHVLMSRPAAFQFLNIICGLGAEESSIVQCAVHDDCDTAWFHLPFETAYAFGFLFLD